MAKQRPASDVPACYASVFPGLEPIAAAEIESSLGGEIKRTGPGVVVFRVAEVTPDLLRLRTVEDVFLLAWGTDKLSYRAEDLDHIRRWTSQDGKWDRLLQLHHALRPRPKGKPTYRIVTQMNGEHGYRRMDARAALAKGLQGKLPASWPHAEENASVEIWLTIDGATAVCGLRLSDASMRHRTYKKEHLAASLRPTVAAAMVRLAGARRQHVVLDPMCGVGTILAEQLGAGVDTVCGGDLDPVTLRAAAANLRRMGRALLTRWDARRLPLESQSVDRIVSNPPFGKQLSKPEEIGPLYRAMLAEYHRVLRPNGGAALLVADAGALMEAARPVGWKRQQQFRVRVLGQMATLSVWQKGDGP